MIVLALLGWTLGSGQVPTKEDRGLENLTLDNQDSNINDLILSARNLRELLWQDPHRPRYHLMPPEGYFNDANGALFWNGRYHLFYLARTPIPHPEKPGKKSWVALWDHVSSRDLVHWVYHPPAVIPKKDGSMPMGIFSGGAIKNAPRPTLIYFVPGQGILISVAQDDDLIEWKELPQNPVILPGTKEDEFGVGDPSGWYEDGKYYALVGGKNRKRGYDGDCTSLFTSTDLVNWDYQGPFYKSERKWTREEEDAACSDFYRLDNSDTHMLLMHSHRPFWSVTHYYLGRYENERFFPENHGRMSWLGGQLSGPESLIDGDGRNIFFGWIAENRLGGEYLFGYDNELLPGKNDLYAWGSVMSLPRVMSLLEDGVLGIKPAPELEMLRYNPRQKEDIEILQNKEVTLEGMDGDVLELFVELDPGDAREIGVKVRCSPDKSEETLITYNPAAGTLTVNFQKSTVKDNVIYRGFYHTNEPYAGMIDHTTQKAPFQLKDGETLKLRIFLDRSVLEVFANDRQCITQRIYPSKPESQEIRLFARGGNGKALDIKAWDMEQVTPW